MIHNGDISTDRGSARSASETTLLFLRQQAPVIPAPRARRNKKAMKTHENKRERC